MKSFSVTLLMTEQCNLRCNYCYEEFSYKSPTLEILERIKALFSNLSRNYDDVHVSFFGGEPTLALKKIRQIIEHNKQISSKFSYSITSNGTLLTEQLLQGLVNDGLVQAQITLDGLGASHDAARKTRKGTGTFSKIYESLLSYRSVVGDFEVIIRVNASPGSVKDIPVLANNLVHDFGADQRFKAYIRSVGKWGGSGDDKLDTLGEEAFAKVLRAFDEVVPQRMIWRTSEKGICYAALPNHLLIYPDGRLGKCTVGIHDDLNSIGYIDDVGKVCVDAEKFSYWSRGFVSGDKHQLACPYWAQ